MNLRIKRINPKADAYRAHPTDAGLDLYACLEDEEKLRIEPEQIELVPTGIAVEIPEGYFGMLVPRSGFSLKSGIGLVNSVGVIDSDYRGEVKAACINHSSGVQTISDGDRICQLLIVPIVTPTVEFVADLDDTARGEGGFGSTGSQ